MGVQQTPPNTVMISLAMFLTFFIMAPTFNAAYENAVQPLLSEQIDEMEAFDRGLNRSNHLCCNTRRPKDLELFTELSEAEPVTNAMDVPIHIVIPSFMISELRRAFENRVYPIFAIFNY